MSTLGVTWMDREPPLEPCAVTAWGPIAQSLAKRLLELDRAASSRLVGVGGPNAIVVLGAATSLPWVDGVVYLGRDSSAPALLLPTHLNPVIPGPFVLEQALRKKFPKLEPPLAVLPDNRTVISCRNALPLLAARLEAWLKGGTS